MIRLSARQLLARFSVLTTARLVGAVAVFVTNVIIARHFGAEALGQFALFVATVSVVAVILPAGFSAIGPILASEYAAKRQHGLLAGFVASARKITCVTSGLLAAAVLVLVGFAPDLIGQDHLWVAIFVCISAPGLALINLDGGVLAGINRQLHGLLPDTFAKPVFVLTGVCAVAVAVAGANVQPHILMAIFAASVWFTAIVTNHLWRRASAIIDGGKVEFDRTRWRATAYPWIVISLLWDFVIELHLMMAGLLAAPAQVAILHVCFRCRALAGYGMRTIYALLLPEIISRNANDDTRATQASIARANALALAYSIVVMVSFAIAGKFLLSVFGPAFTDGLPILLLVSSVMVVRAVFGPAPAILTANGHQYAMMAILAGSMALSVVLMILLCPVFGITGIAIAYCAMSAVCSVLLWFHARRVTGIDCSIFSIFRSDALNEAKPTPSQA